MANETTSNSLNKLYTNKTNTKGSYRVYKPKPLKMPKGKKWKKLFTIDQDQQDSENQNLLTRKQKHIKKLEDQQVKNLARKIASLKTYT